MDKFSELKAAAMDATLGPWEWFTSNSMARLSSTPSGKDGDVLSAFRASDGVPCVSVSQRDMAFIAAANPAVILALLAELEAKDEQKDIRVAEIEKRLKQRAEEMERILEGITPEMIAGGWTAKGISDYAKSLEAKLATPVRLPARKAVRHPAGYPEDAAREVGYNEALFDVGEALDAQGFAVEGDE
ncbi:TPA: ead/Ea22-like family protein [Serratia marcescens]